MANPPLIGHSAVPTVSGVVGTNTSTDRNAVGVEGSSDDGFGVYGHSKHGRGVVAASEDNYALRAHSNASSAVRADSDKGVGIEATSKVQRAIVGTSTSSDGVWGVSQQNGFGVLGVSESGIGVQGKSTLAAGVRGDSPNNIGVSGASNAGIGVLGESNQFEGVRGVAHHRDHGAVVGKHLGGGIAVYAESLDPNSDQPVLWAKHGGNRLAAKFEGSIVVTETIDMGNADCAEDFDIADDCCAEPGTVMVLTDESALRESSSAYDTRVAGVLSGAGSYRPGIVLDRQNSRGQREPVALFGKVYCKVDARFGSIGIGDLLTTSPTPGHAMRADDPHRAFGAVIGKALRPFSGGQGLIPILVALQ